MIYATSFIFSTSTTTAVFLYPKYSSSKDDLFTIVGCKHEYKAKIALLELHDQHKFTSTQGPLLERLTSQM